MKRDKYIHRLSRKPYCDNDGNRQVGIEIEFNDGTCKSFESSSNMPADIRQAYRDFRRGRITAIQSERRAPEGFVLAKGQRNRRSLFGMRWTHSAKGFSITWPSISYAMQLVGIGLVLVVTSSIKLAFDNGGLIWWVGAVVGLTVSFLIFVSTIVLREDCQLSPQSLSCSRWPGRFRARKAVPRKALRNAVLHIDVAWNGRGYERCGTLALRVRRSHVMDSWYVGGSMSEAVASDLARQIRFYTDVREIRS